jgi:hypothetical protein
LQSNELFSFSQATGFLLLLAFFSLYVSISKSALRYIFYFAGWPILYLLIGGFSVPVIFMCAFHELLFRKQNNRYFIFVLFIITGVLLPYIFAELFFYIPNKKIYTYPILFELHSNHVFALMLLIVWNPLLLLVIYFFNKNNSFKHELLLWNQTNVMAGTLAIIIMGFVVYKYAYNRKIEIMLGMDYHTQKAEWAKVLKLSDQYPDLNRFMLYYTNLALYKTSSLCEKMFNYPQIGSNGLRLDWKHNINFFFGGEVFYYLSYTNEA